MAAYILCKVFTSSQNLLFSKSIVQCRRQDRWGPAAVVPELGRKPGISVRCLRRGRRGGRGEAAGNQTEIQGYFSHHYCPQVVGDGENHGQVWVTEGNVLRCLSDPYHIPNLHGLKN